MELFRIVNNKRLFVSLEFKLADMWCGLFWKNYPDMGILEAWVCIIPTLPLHIIHSRKGRLGV